MSTPPKKVRQLNSPEAYNLWSQSYDRFDNPMLAMVDHAFALDPLNLKSRKVVELGCGTGRNIERIFAAGAVSYVGLDQSSGMLTSAQLKYPDAKFLSADIQTCLPLEDASTEYVLSTLVFEHLQKLQSTAGFQAVSIKTLFADAEAIKRCAKLSKHEGQAVLFDIQAIKDLR